MKLILHLEVFYFEVSIKHDNHDILETRLSTLSHFFLQRTRVQTSQDFLFKNQSSEVFIYRRV